MKRTDMERHHTSQAVLEVQSVLHVNVYRFNSLRLIYFNKLYPIWSNFFFWPQFWISQTQSPTGLNSNFINVNLILIEQQFFQCFICFNIPIEQFQFTLPRFSPMFIQCQELEAGSFFLKKILDSFMLGFSVNIYSTNRYDTSDNFLVCSVLQ